MGMRQKGYRDRRVLIFQRGELGQKAWNEVTWLQRTTENAQDEILHNSIFPLGPNPEVHAENFLYIRRRKTIVRLQQKISYSLPSPHTTTNMPSQQLLPAELHQQVEEIKKAWEAQEKEKREWEEALLQAAEEEEKWEAERKQQEEEERKWWAEATLEAERELREQGWQLDESLEEFQRRQWREEKRKEANMEDRGPCLGCWSRKMECIQE